MLTPPVCGSALRPRMRTCGFFGRVLKRNNMEPTPAEHHLNNWMFVCVLVFLISCINSYRLCKRRGISVQGFGNEKYHIRITACFVI